MYHQPGRSSKYNINTVGIIFLFIIQALLITCAHSNASMGNTILPQVLAVIC